MVEAINAGAREQRSSCPACRWTRRSRATGDLADLAGCDLVLAVPPAQHMRATLAAFAPHARDGLPVVLCSKGVEQGSLKLMTEVLAETLPQARARGAVGPQLRRRGGPRPAHRRHPGLPRRRPAAAELAEAIATPDLPALPRRPT